MKRGWLKSIILAAVFIVSLFIFTAFINRGRSQNIEQMQEPELPLVSMYYQDYAINRMQGYRQKMQVEYMRDGITPIETDRTLTVGVETFGQTFDAMTYEVITADGKSVVENGKIGRFLEDGNVKKAEFKIENPILMNQEYSLCLTIHQKDKEIYYYTRLLQRSGLNIGKYLTFVQTFYEKCINKDKESGLAASLEPNEYASNSSFTDVNIHSSLQQVTWGELQPKIYRKATVTIEEINQTTASLSLRYMITAPNEKGDIESYYVKEFYRMKYDQSKVMLLDFTRSASQIISGEQGILTNQGIHLGVNKKDVQYVTDSGGNVTAFVNNGDLWSYNASANKLAQVFSFRKDDKADERKDYVSRGIKIVRVEENGDMDFVLYGYMNRGDHEGRSGIGVYHYNSELNANEERIFIPISKSFDFLNSEIETLAYVNTNNQLYVYLDEDLYKVDLNKKKSEIVRQNINPDCLVISKTQSHIAWMDEMDESASTTITLMDLESGEQKKISANNGEKIKALGFMNEDLVYGLATDDYIFRDAVGNVTFSMYSIKIQNFDGHLIKEYRQDNVWVKQVNIEEGLLELIRISRDENGNLVEISNDHIMNNLQKNNENVSIKSRITRLKGMEITMVLKEPIEDKNPLLVYSRIARRQKNQLLNLDIGQKEERDHYYVYGQGGLDCVCTKVKDAIVRADQIRGVVLNKSQQYIWERGNKDTESRITIEEALPGILTGTLDEAQLQGLLQDEAQVLNLTGCSLEQVLYQVSRQRPVVVKISDTQSRVIVGYDRYNTWLYNPETKEVSPMGMQDSTNLFASYGNVFVSYIENFRPKAEG